MRNIFFIALALLGACASPAPPQQKAPITSEFSDEALRQMLTTHLKNAGAPISSRYFIHREDLNHDGNTDALILMRTPYGYWCDTLGCKMLVIEAANTGFKTRGAIEPVRTPVFITYNQTNGWRDIMLRVAGRTEHAKHVTLKFNGDRYPQNPERVPANNGKNTVDLITAFDTEGTSNH